MRFLFSIPINAHLAVLIPGRAFWPYFAAAVVLVVGLTRIIRGEELQARGIDRATVLGPLFFAIPMAAFGADPSSPPTSLPP